MYIHESLTSNFPPNGKFEVRFPSVTKMLGETSDKSFLEAWKARIGEEEANRISRESAAFGDSLHTLIENHFLGLEQEPLPSGKLSFTFSNLQRKLKEFKIETLGIEVPMQSKVLRLQGRCDFICILNGELSIVDWKTTKDRKPKAWLNDYFLQATAYSLMFKEMVGELPKRLNLFLSNEFICQYETEVLTREWVDKLKRRRDDFEAIKSVAHSDVINNSSDSNKRSDDSSSD